MSMPLLISPDINHQLSKEITEEERRQDVETMTPGKSLRLDSIQVKLFRQMLVIHQVDYH